MTEVKPCCGSFEPDTNSKEPQHRQIILMTPKVVSVFKFKFTYILSPNLIFFGETNGFKNMTADKRHC